MSRNLSPLTKAGKPRKKTGPAPKPDADRKAAILKMRATAEYVNCVKEVAEFTGEDVSGLIDRALTMLMRHIRYPKPLPPR